MKKLNSLFLILGAIILIVLTVLISTAFINNPTLDGEEDDSTTYIEEDEEEIYSILLDDELNEILSKINTTFIGNYEDNYPYNFFGSPDLYDIVGFQDGNIPNEYVLKSAWESIINDIRNIDDYFHTEGYSADGIEIIGIEQSENGVGSITISKEKMAEKIMELFGDITYTNTTFDNSAILDYEDTMYPNWSDGEYDNTVNYEDGYYSGYFVDGGGTGYDAIWEYFSDYVLDGDILQIYVHTCFVDLGTDSDSYYYDFNLTNVIETSNDYLNESQVNSLDTYVYTYTLNNPTDTYYLTGFYKL